VARLSLVMMFDPPENNVLVDGLDRRDVEVIYAALRAARPDLFPEKRFTWQKEGEARPSAWAMFRWPTDGTWITQRFGENPEIYRKFGLPGHEGIDIGVVVGTPVYAAADGVVVSTEQEHRAGDKHNYGNHVILEHRIRGLEYRTIYAHLQRAKVDEGERVTRGNVIGLSGNTGRFTTGPHLHFSVQRVGATSDGATVFPNDYVDPLPLLE